MRCYESFWSIRALAILIKHIHWNEINDPNFTFKRNKIEQIVMVFREAGGGDRTGLSGSNGEDEDERRGEWRREYGDRQLKLKFIWGVMWINK